MAMANKRGVKCRNSGTWTEAMFWSKFREMYRKLSMYWKPGEDYLKSIRRPKTEASGPGKHKFEYPCEHCNNWFKREEVAKDHITPVGNISSWDSLAKAGERMFIEMHEGWQCLCKPCHIKKTNGERSSGS